jgi:uncharacterized membrane protein
VTKPATGVLKLRQYNLDEQNSGKHLTKLGPLVRLDLFTDAVFAIVITLLALEINLPEDVKAANLTSVLRHMYPVFLVHMISFTVLAIEWIDHHSMFERVVKCTRALIISNLVFCFTLTTIPFLTKLLGLFPDSRPAVALYSLGIFVMSAGKELLWQVISRQAKTHSAGKFRIKYAAPLCVSLVSAGVAMVHPKIVVYVWILFGVISVVRRLEVRQRSFRSP